MYGSDFEDLVNKFMKFPGIGPRQARRFVYFLLSQDKIFRIDFIKTLDNLNLKAKQCSRCAYFFVASSNQSLLCQRCHSLDTDKSTLMIVEKDMDIDNIIKTGTYKGSFFVLGSLKSKTLKRLGLLKKIITAEAKSGTLKEIIIAFSASTDGDHMDHLLKKELEPIVATGQLKISSLGRGLSTGAELEYSDAETIANALLGRH
ncbi:MAG: toprim domain-containing protein [Candidatus Paceibacterota bacterium]